MESFAGPDVNRLGSGAAGKDSESTASDTILFTCPHEAGDDKMDVHLYWASGSSSRSARRTAFSQLH